MLLLLGETESLQSVIKSKSALCLFKEWCIARESKGDFRMAS